MAPPLPALFIGHGSPMNVITDGPDRQCWQALARALPRPEAILCISAHWQTQGATGLTGGAAPHTIHDFGNFPQALFDMQYPAPGSEELVARVLGLTEGHAVVRDETWGFDHGVWGVLQPMYPECDVPTVAMSLNRSLDAQGHLDLAARLTPLRDEGVLIVASGNVIHNLSEWRAAGGRQLEWAKDFRARSNDAILAGDLDALTRFAPDDRAAALAINSAEHYLPLLYALALRRAEDQVTLFNDTLDGALSMTSVLLGDPALLAGIQ